MSQWELSACSWIYPAMGLFPWVIFRAFFKLKKFWLRGDLFRLSCLAALFFLQWWEKGKSWNREKSFVTFHQLLFAWAFSCKLLVFLGRRFVGFVMKFEVLNPISSSTFLLVSLVFFNAPFIQINKQGKSGIFGSSTFTYCVECSINTII